LSHKSLFRAGCEARPEARTKAFTAENAEHAESIMKTLMLYLSDLCGLCGKMLEIRFEAE